MPSHTAFTHPTTPPPGCLAICARPLPSYTAFTHPTTPPRAAWLSARGEVSAWFPSNVRLTRFAHFTSPPSLTRNTTQHRPRPPRLLPLHSHSPRPLRPLPPQPATTKCTASAGNFGQGLAWCCQELGVKCTVVAPDHAPQTKLDAMRGYGAEVLTVPYEKWWEIIESHRCPQAPGAVFIHPGAENAVLAGNATVAAEILEELPDVDTVVAPYGSGALCVGIACGVKALGSTCRVVAVEPATAAPFALSRRAGRACRFDAWEPSFVDGCGGKAVLDEIWALAHEHCAHLDG